CGSYRCTGRAGSLAKPVLSSALSALQFSRRPARQFSLWTVFQGSPGGGWSAVVPDEWWTRLVEPAKIDFAESASSPCPGALRSSKQPDVFHVNRCGLATPHHESSDLLHSHEFGRP